MEDNKIKPVLKPQTRFGYDELQKKKQYKKNNKKKNDKKSPSDDGNVIDEFA